jgi:hypothetical protein
MCEACFVQGYSRFDSWQTFEAFEHQLRLKDLQWWKRPGNWPAYEPLTAYEPDEFRKCHMCSQVWALSSPDNAWRGYFLPEAEALAHVQGLRSHDRASAWGCGGVIAAGLLLLLVRWLW